MSYAPSTERLSHDEHSQVRRAMMEGLGTDHMRFKFNTTIIREHLWTLDYNQMVNDEVGMSDMRANDCAMPFRYLI